MTISDSNNGRLNTRPHCVEDEFLIRLMKRGLRTIIRGTATTFMMSIEMLDMPIEVLDALWGEWPGDARATLSLRPLAYIGGDWSLGAHYHHHHHQQQHHGHFHHGWGLRRRSDDEAAENASSPARSKTRTGVCCGDCRLCTENVCLKTGAARKKRAV